MRIFIIQSGTYNTDSSLEYSITSKRQVSSLLNAGVKIKVGLVSNRTSPTEIRKNIHRLRKEVNAYQPNIIHAHYGSMVGWVAMKVSQHKYPFIVSFCGNDLLGSPNSGVIWRFREYLSKRMSQQVAKKATQVIVKSENLFKALSDKSKRKTTIIPNGVDSNFFRPSDDKYKIRNQLNWDVSVFTVFFNASTGSNRAVKNTALAYETILKIKELGLNVRLEEVTQLAPIKFRDSMVASDCLLVTSLHEGSPNIVKEALACNLPVVTVNCGDVSSRLENVAIGGVFSYDAVQLAAGIKKVSEFKGTFNGREEFLKQGLSEDTIVKELIELYKKAML